MRKRVPTHPGAILREDVLPSLPGITVSAFARKLGVSRQTFDRIVRRARMKIGRALVKGLALRILKPVKPAGSQTVRARK